MSDVISRLNLFGITGAARVEDLITSSPRLPRLNLFGITGAASRVRSAVRKASQPPQSLWNHGCCEDSATSPPVSPLSRLNLFGITGAASRNFIGSRTNPLSASISLESRVLRGHAFPPSRKIHRPASISLESRVLREYGDTVHGCSHFPPQSLWNHGCCESVRVAGLWRWEFRLNLFGITGAASHWAN